jgi:copper chaperone CopZ
MAEKQIAFPVTGMNCNGCVASVTRSLNTLEGVSAVEVSLPGEAVVTFDEGRVTLDDLYGRVVKAGYGVPGTPATHGCE